MTDLPSTANIPDHLSGERLDAVLAQMFPQYSRNRLKQWVQEGLILLDGEAVKPKVKVYTDQLLTLDIDTDELDVDERCEAEAIVLDIVFEDEHLIVVNKPAALVVHPAAGHRSGTLQNALLFHDASLAAVPRAGIVHRLDKDTSGLMVVARNLQAHHYLVDQLQQRLIKREYQALVHGVMTGGGVVDAPIGRHPQDRVRMAIRPDGRDAVTHYRLLQKFRAHCHVHLMLETGRTHQIRVHMQHLRYPIVGDPVYSGRARVPPNASAEFLELLRSFSRQALHAWRLSLEHPQSGELMEWEVAPPPDMAALRAAMEADAAMPAR